MRVRSIFATVDLFQCYWQIEIGKTCEKVLFICRYGPFQFEATPFGLMDSQATFQRILDRIILNTASLRCYFDQAVLFSINDGEHATHLENVFTILKKNGLRMRIKKCYFMHLSVEILEHIVDLNGVQIHNQMAEKVGDAIPSATQKKLRSLLELAANYRRFISGFAKIARPLNEKNSEKFKFFWSEDLQTAFEELKVNLTSMPVLVYPDCDKLFLFCTDALRKEVGSILSQVNKNARDYTVQHATRTLSFAESN